MSIFAIIIILIGLSLTAVAVGFLVMVIRAFNGPAGREDRAQILETARQLERTLAVMENRLGALEDIILTGARKESPHE